MSDVPAALVRFSLDDDGRHVLFWHRCNYVGIQADGTVLGRLPATEITQGMLPAGDTAWTVVQRDPLTVTPSILCSSCGCHGFITGGKWVPA